MNEILLFGVTQEIVGDTTLRIGEEAQPESVGDLRRLLLDRYPELGKITSLKVAVNNNFVEDHTRLHPGDEVALIPPVSGG